MRLRTGAVLLAPLVAAACGTSPVSHRSASELPLTTAQPDQYPVTAPSEPPAALGHAPRPAGRSVRPASGAPTSAAVSSHPVATAPAAARANAPTVDTSCRRPASSVGSGVAAKGQTPPPFTATTVDCKVLDFGQFSKGRPTLVTFYASWCEGCQAEAKDLEAVYQEWHPKNGFVIVGVDTKDEASNPSIYYRHFHWTFASVWDDKEKILDAWLSDVSASALPVSFWIKPDGTVNDITIGSESRSQMEQEMSAL